MAFIRKRGKSQKVSSFYLNDKRFNIVGSGRSAEVLPVEKFAGGVTVWINNSVTHSQFDELAETSLKNILIFAPLHAPQSVSEWKDWLFSLDSAIAGREFLVCVGESRDARSASKIIESFGLFKDAKLLSYWVAIGKDTSVDRCLEFDFQRRLIPARACSVYALILSLWMKASRIDLYGLDHDYILYQNESDMRFYKNGIHQVDEFKRTFGGRFHELEWLRQYQIMTQYRQIFNYARIPIINQSQRSLCRIFPKAGL